MTMRKTGLALLCIVALARAVEISSEDLTDNFDGKVVLTDQENGGNEETTARRDESESSDSLSMQGFFPEDILTFVLGP